MSRADGELPLVSKLNNQGTLLAENEDAGTIVRLEATADGSLKTSTQLIAGTADIGNVGLLDEDGDRVGVQTPLSVDGDSIYSKDVNTTTSDIGGFTGAVTDLFDDIASTITDTSATNPKEISVKLNRPIDTAIFKICTNTGDYSNVKIILKDAAGNTTATIDDSANNTKYTANEYATSPTGFCNMVLQFHTADTVTLGFVLVQKAIHTHSQLLALKPDDTTTFINATNGGNLKVSLEELESGISTNSNSQLNVTNYDSSGVAVCTLLDWAELTCAVGSRPLISAVSKVNKFGAAPDFDTADGEVTVWDGADDGAAFEKMVYTYSSTADITHLQSTSASDTVDIEVQGLDTNGDLVTQTKTLTGTTAVALDTALKRVFRMKNTGAADLVGYVYCSVTSTASAANIRAVIQIGNNQTEMALYTIPTGKTGYIRYIYGSSAGASRSTKYLYKLKTRADGGVFQLKFKEAISDDAQLERPYDVLLGGFSAGTDIEMTCELTAVGVTAAGVIGGFDIILVDD